jgi:hypothetical protein
MMGGMGMGGMGGYGVSSFRYCRLMMRKLT